MKGSIVRFNDGVEFDTSGGLRVESRHDGYYVVGKGMLIPVDSREDGEQFMRESAERHKPQRRNQNG